MIGIRLIGIAICWLGLALATTPELHAGQITLPGSILIAGSGRDHDPAAAFNTVDRTWLIVWREADVVFPTASTIMGRIVRDDRAVLTAPFVIGFGNHAPPPRVAHDPIRNEWMVVFAGDCVIDTCAVQVSRRGRWPRMARSWATAPGRSRQATAVRPSRTWWQPEAFPEASSSLRLPTSSLSGSRTSRRSRRSWRSDSPTTRHSRAASAFLALLFA